MQILLYKLRKEAKLSQQDVADFLGISVVSYRNKEKSVNQFTQDEMFKLSRFFNEPMSKIFLDRKSPIR